jgi:hypothetical protein
MQFPDFERLPQPAELTATLDDLLLRTKLGEKFLTRELGVTELLGGGLAIPYRDAAGRVVAVRRRWQAEVHDGWHRDGDWLMGRPCPYGLDRLQPLPPNDNGLILVADELDAWALWSEGFAALALPLPDVPATLELAPLAAAGVGVLQLNHPRWTGDYSFTLAVGRRLAALGYAGPLQVWFLKDGWEPCPSWTYRLDRGWFDRVIPRSITRLGQPWRVVPWSPPPRAPLMAWEHGLGVPCDFPPPGVPGGPRDPFTATPRPATAGRPGPQG